MALELLGGAHSVSRFGGTVNIRGGLICVLVGLSLGYLTGGSLSKKLPSIRTMDFSVCGGRGLNHHRLWRVP